jgi:hypothetical protein
MKVYCKICQLPLSQEVQWYEGQSFGTGDGMPYIQRGWYTMDTPDNEGCIVINIEDGVNLQLHTLQSRINGCCGLDGLDGLNQLCANGHEVATERSDCWMTHQLAFEKEKVLLR